MLNPRAHPLHQESNRLKVGECIVDIPRREITGPAHAEPSRLTVKALHVLLALVGHQGRVVSREALLEWVWPDTMPTDDVLTQAIGQLRRAFADDRDAHRYVETISKGGYRLVAPVQWLDSEPEPMHLQGPADGQVPKPAEPARVATARPARHSRQWIAALALVLLAGAGAAAWWMGQRAPRAGGGAVAPTPAAREFPFVTITSRPGREINPSLSPDGAMVAYVQVDEDGYGSIMLQTTAHVPGRSLSATPAGSSDIMPVWSPDGRTIAFVRYDSGKRCQIMLIAASGGNERRIADCFAGAAAAYDWTPDGRGLVMGLEARLPGESRSPLRILDIASGKWRALDYAIADGDIDIDPHYSPDGKWLVFRRSISLSDFWRMPATGGVPERLTRVKSDIRGWDWLPDSSGLVFSYIGNAVGMFHYDMGSGQVAQLTMDGEAVFPDVARHAPTMVFTVEQSIAGIFRLDLPATPGAPVTRSRVFASSRSEMLPSISPDGRMLAFISDRASRLELWLGELAKPDSARLVEGIMPVPRHTPVWSRDGRRLLVVGNQTGQQSLYEVEVESGRLQPLPVPAPTPIYAAYTARSDRLLVGSDSGDGRLRAVLYDTSSAPWRELAALRDVALVRHDPVGDRFYFTRVTKPGIWSAGPDLQDVQVVDALRPRLAREYKRWNIGRDGVYFLDWSEDCATGWIRMGAPEKARPLCLDRDVEAWPLTPVIAPAGKSLFLTLDVSNNSDIGLADLGVVTSEAPARSAQAR